MSDPAVPRGKRADTPARTQDIEALPGISETHTVAAATLPPNKRWDIPDISPAFDRNASGTVSSRIAPVTRATFDAPWAQPVG